jgi:molybdenum-dependent DNA-binding transcriptional regulator ModE
MVRAETAKLTALAAAVIATYDEARKVVQEQAEDEALWFKATTVAEAHLQRELRRLHAVIEGE